MLWTYRAKIKLSAALVPSGGSRGRPILYLFRLPGAASIPWFEATLLSPNFCGRIGFSSVVRCTSTAYLLAHLGLHLGFTVMIQDNLPIAESLTLKGFAI